MLYNNLTNRNSPTRNEGAHSVTDLTVTPNISKFLRIYPKKSSLVTAVDLAVSIGVAMPSRMISKNNNKNLAMLTTCNQSHETQCILRANGIIKEDVSALAEGKRLVPVPMQDIGCEVGLHGGKWGSCELKTIIR